MKSNIRLLSINDVKEFVNAACAADYEIDLVSGRYTIDAKSIMGIFSLDLTKPIEMHLHTDDEEKGNAFLEKVKDYLV